MIVDDLSGQTFGRLTVIRRKENRRFPSGQTQKIYLCGCSCGNEIAVQSGHLKQRHTTSCGCHRNEITSARSTTHGYTKNRKVPPEYVVWRAMKRRCSVKSDPSYKNYGARGIKVSSRWKSFKNFIEDMGPRPTTAHTLERVDNSRGYTSKNCRWTSRREQNRNTRKNILITHKGKTKCLKDWSEETDLAYSTLYGRYRRGWSVPDILGA